MHALFFTPMLYLIFFSSFGQSQGLHDDYVQACKKLLYRNVTSFQMLLCAMNVDATDSVKRFLLN